MHDSHQILIIEDDPDTIDLLQVVVRSGGYEPVAALGGREGLARAAQLKPALVLLDLMMGDIDGWTVLRTIKEDPAMADVPVVILSVRDPAEDEALVATHGELFADFVRKPFGVRELLETIKQLVGA